MLRGAGYPGLELELEEIQQCCEEEKAEGNGSLLEEIQSRTFVIPMSIFTLIFILLGCTGNDTMVFLGPSIFAEVKITNNISLLIFFIGGCWSPG